MTIYQDREIARFKSARKGDAQTDRSAVWTSVARLYGEGNGCHESHGGAA